jgi:methionyl-tRNA formyltransferase
MMLKVVFLGSPAFALPTLEVLATNYNLVGVVTQPDRPAGRGRALTPPPVKEKALEKGVPVIQPRRISSPEALDQLQIWSPDLIVVAAFGQILKTAVLDLPPEGCVNVHASLLPLWRGGAPIQAAILNGDRETGVTIMQMDAGLDTGPIISQEAIPIQPEDTGGSMDSRLARLGANLLQATLPEYLAGNLLPQPQAEDQATFAPLLAKQDGLLDFNESAQALTRRVQAFSPWPGTFTTWKGQTLKILGARAVPEPVRVPDRLAPGDRTTLGGWPAIVAREGLLVLEKVQPAGKRPLAGDEFLRGARDW